MGKSQVTNVLYEALVRYLDRMPGENPDEVKVLKAAPTGKASWQMLHGIFRIPINCGFKYCPLDQDRLTTVRSQLQSCQEKRTPQEYINESII